jgi:hypothetical protein
MNWKEAVAVVSTTYPNISLDRPKTRVKLPGLVDQTPIQNTKPEPPESETGTFVSVKL